MWVKSESSTYICYNSHMSGHSKWSTIKREKGAKDAKRGAVFTKIGNMIAIAARGGTDPNMNSNLAMAIEKAKQANMPAANIQRAVDRAADKNAAVLEEITYEGIGPGGVGIIIEVATDNRNRTFPEVKNVLTKNGGRIADAGSVMFQFTRKGVIRVAQTMKIHFWQFWMLGPKMPLKKTASLLSIRN